MSTQLDRAESHLATAGERKEPTHQPHGLIPIRRNQSRKIEILNTEIYCRILYFLTMHLVIILGK